jgi:cytochrome c-type biogenesis protein
MLDGFSHTSLMTAFLAGLLSFVSPCVLPLIPSYLMYITGLSFQQLTQPGETAALRTAIVVNTALFIAGFSMVFIAFGASATYAGRLLADHQSLIRHAGAVLLIAFGVYLLGLVKLPLLMREHRLHLSRRPAGYIGSFVVGAAFAAGWTPCVGPILGTILLYAGTAETVADGITLLAFYSFGLGLPLLVASLGLNRFLSSLGQIRPYWHLVSRLSGVFLIAIGTGIYLDKMTLLTSLFEQYGIGFDISLDRR